eukprot:GFKZ01003187.1.p1 GENE.GFKZ01003187.1~~GFKZ01003187.1.p1  ORF type:complete len:591 (+),score=61.34 GFKZ01003187.1:928-2700(+)
MLPANYPAQLSPSASNPRHVTEHPSASVQKSAQLDGSRLIEHLESLLMVVMTVITARIHTTKSFMSMASASSAAYDIRELALRMPLPRLVDTDIGFMALVLTAACDAVPTLFDGPCVDVDGFLVGIVERSRAVCQNGVPNAALLLMLIYVDKIYANCPAMMLSEGNAARLMAAAYALATQTLEGVPHRSTAMERVLGMRGEDLQKLESAFVRLLGHDLCVSSDAFIHAEVSFIAEALETEIGGDVLRNMHMAGVSGLELSLELAKNWTAEDQDVIPETAGKGDAREGMSYVGERKFWRFFSHPHCQWVAENSMPARIIGLARAQYRLDFRHIALEMQDEEGEWYAMAICERVGVERFRRLRAILLRKDLSVTEIPQMRMRRMPFMAIPAGWERRDGEDFVAALGEHRRDAIAENWRAALVIPDPSAEAAGDAGLEFARHNPQWFSRGSVSEVRHGPPGFLPTPRLTWAGRHNPPGFLTQLGTCHGLLTAIAHTPSGRSSIGREEEATSQPEPTVFSYRGFSRGSQRAAATLAGEVLLQEPGTAAGNAIRGSVTGRRANRSLIAGSVRRGDSCWNWAKIRALKVRSGPRVS